MSTNEFRGLNGESCEETVKRVYKEFQQQKVTEAKRIFDLAYNDYPQFLIEKEEKANLEKLKDNSEEDNRLWELANIDYPQYALQKYAREKLKGVSSEV